MQYIDPNKLNPRLPSPGGMMGGQSGYPTRVPMGGAYGPQQPSGGQSGYPTRIPMGGSYGPQPTGGSMGGQSGYPTRIPMSGGAPGAMGPQQRSLLDRYFGAPQQYNGGESPYDQGWTGPLTQSEGQAQRPDQSNIFRTQDDYYRSLTAGRGDRAPTQSNITVGGEGGRLVTDEMGRPMQGANVGGINASRYGNLVDLPTYNTMFGTNFSGYGGQDYGGDWRGNMDTANPFDNLMQGLSQAGIAYGSAGLGNAVLNTANTSQQDQADANARSNRGVMDTGGAGGVQRSPGGTAGFTEGGGANFPGLLGGGGLGGLIGGGLSLAGGNEQLKAYEEAQRAAQAAGQFQPYNVFSGVGSTTMGPNGLTSSLSPQYQGLRDQYLGNAAAGAGAAGSFDPNQMANQMYGQMQAQAAPGEAEQRANAIAQLQGMGQMGLGVGADTGNGPANPLYSSLLKAQADAGRQRQLSAYGQSQDMANQMQQRALGWGGAGLGLDQSQLGQQQLSGYLGGLGSNAALGGARLAQGPIMAQGMTKGGFLSGLGGGLMGGAGSNSGIPGFLRQQFPGLFGNGGGNQLGYNEDPLSGVDQYGFTNDQGFPSEFDSGVDWSNLYG